MLKFEIIKKEPLEHKEKILEFWDKYLPGTSVKRFDWLKNNPSGPTIWIFAFDTKSNELVGTISILKHEMYKDGKVIHAGIVGDFMVSSTYRVFGPATPLQKQVIASKNELGFQILYTIPNSASRKLALRIGYTEKIKMCHMIRPLKSEFYILKNVKNRLLKNLVCSIFNNILRILPIGKFIAGDDKFESVTTVDDSFDKFWIKIKTQPSIILGNRSSDYLTWHYCHNPVSKFEFLKYEDNKTAELLGYIVYSIQNNKISIFDLIALEENQIDKLLKRLLEVAYNKSYKAIYIRLSTTNPYINKLKKFMFFDAKDDISVLVLDDEPDATYDNWIIYEYDRNI